jgi:putative tryptophan/tyrosine transport system substrate-binding protein
MRRVGLLLPTPESDSEEQRRATVFVEALQEQGWIDGRNIHIDYRWCGSDTARVRNSAAELVKQKPDAIVADSALAVAPLRQLTSTIPIVFLQIGDPVESGFVENLARPGGTITGFTPGEFSTRAKMLELLKEVAPQVTHVNVIYNPVQAPQTGMLRAIETAAVPLGIQVKGASAGNADEITHIFEGFVGSRTAGLLCCRIRSPSLIAAS